MKVYTNEDILEIDKKYNMECRLSRFERLSFQNIDLTRKAGIKYLMNDSELREWAKCFNSVEYFADNFFGAFYSRIFLWQFCAPK